MIVGVSMMRDEADVCGRVVAHLRSQGVDRFLVGDHGSTDRTRVELLRAGCHVVPLRDPGYYQSRFMSQLAKRAWGLWGAEWIVPFDADEFWFGTDGRTVGQVLGESRADVEMATSYEQFEDQRGPAKRLCKVAFRYQPGCVIAQGNHDVVGAGTVRASGNLMIREFQYRSFEQLCRKVRNGKAAYDATDLHQMEGAHWREMGAMSDGELRSWWWQHLGEFEVHDPVPW